MSIILEKFNAFLSSERTQNEFEEIFNEGISYLHQHPRAQHRAHVIAALVNVLIEMHATRLISIEDSKNLKHKIIENMHPDEQSQEGFKEFIGMMIPE